MNLKKGVNVLKNFINTIPNEIRPLVYAIFVVILLVIIIFVIGLSIDHLKKDKYKANKFYYRTLSNSVGGGEEYYYRYWAWQPNKKNFYVKTLLEKQEINRPYTRKAMQKKKYKKSIIPFRREVYGKAK